MRVQTVLGPIRPEELGVAHCHEHLYAIPPKWWADKEPDFLLNSVDNAVKELEGLYAAGGRAVVESTAIDYGRDAQALQAIARRTNVHVIATTGFNKSHYFEKWVYQADADELTELVVREIEGGMDGCDARPGIIKCGTMYNMMEDVGEKVIRVAALAHLRTGVPIMTHTETGTMAPEQLDLLEQEGVDLNRVAISHIDRNPDLPLHIELAKRGAYLIYDCCGKIKYHPDSLKNELIRGLIDAGCGERLLLSQDMGRRSYFRAYGGGPGMDFVLRKFIPRLQREGLPQEWVTTIMVENPRRLLTYLPKQV